MFETKGDVYIHSIKDSRATTCRLTGHLGLFGGNHGTIQMSDGSTDRVMAQGDSYEEAKAVLEAALPGGSRLIVIRTDR